MKRFIILLVFLLPVVLYIGFRCGLHFAYPYPLRFLEANRFELAEYISRLETGAIPFREDGQGYYINLMLSENGVVYVRKEGKYLFFAFQSMPPDPIEELIYSSVGGEDFPMVFVNAQNYRIVSFQYINDHWWFLRRQ